MPKPPLSEAAGKFLHVWQSMPTLSPYSIEEGAITYDAIPPEKFEGWNAIRVKDFAAASWGSWSLLVHADGKLTTAATNFDTSD